MLPRQQAQAPVPCRVSIHVCVPVTNSSGTGGLTVTQAKRDSLISMASALWFQTCRQLLTSYIQLPSGCCRSLGPPEGRQGHCVEEVSLYGEDEERQQVGLASDKLLSNSKGNAVDP